MKNVIRKFSASVIAILFFMGTAVPASANNDKNKEAQIWFTKHYYKDFDRDWGGDPASAVDACLYSKRPNGYIGFRS